VTGAGDKGPSGKGKGQRAYHLPLTAYRLPLTTYHLPLNFKERTYGKASVVHWNQ